jgi:hypothetical protein
LLVEEQLEETTTGKFLPDIPFIYSPSATLIMTASSR